MKNAFVLIAVTLISQTNAHAKPEMISIAEGDQIISKVVSYLEKGAICEDAKSGSDKSSSVHTELSRLVHERNPQLDSSTNTLSLFTSSGKIDIRFSLILKTPKEVRKFEKHTFTSSRDRIIHTYKKTDSCKLSVVRKVSIYDHLDRPFE